MRENPETYEDVLGEKESVIYKKLWNACMEAANKHEKCHILIYTI